jgi:serine/threonine protein kinase
MTITLVLNGVSRPVPRQKLISSCTAFAPNPDLLKSPYTIRSRVSGPAFATFVDALEGRPVAITASNMEDLLLLCGEFGFDPFLSEVRRSIGLFAATFLGRVQDIESRLLQQERQLVRLTSENAALRAAIRRPPPGGATPDAASFIRGFLRPMADFRPGRLLGTGRFGHTYVGDDLTNGRRVVLRQRKEDRSRWRDCWQTRGFQRLLRLSVPGCLRLLAFSVRRVHHEIALDLVMEYAANQSLRVALDGLRKGKSVAGFGPTEMSKCIFGIACTMARLHAVRKMHPYLTDEAVLLDSRFEPLIGDLNEIRYGAWGAQMGELSPSSFLFAAPEVINSEGAFPSSNVYSFGILVYRFFAEFRGDPKQRQAWTRTIILGEVSPRPQGISDELWELVRDCWRLAADRRPDFASIVARLRDSNAWHFPGTDVAQLREYQTRREMEGAGELRPKITWDTFEQALGVKLNLPEAT